MIYINTDNNSLRTYLNNLLQNGPTDIRKAHDILLRLAHAGREHGGHGGAGADGNGALAVHLGTAGGDQLDVLGGVVGFYVHGMLCVVRAVRSG